MEAKAYTFQIHYHGQKWDLKIYAREILDPIGSSILNQDFRGKSWNVKQPCDYR